MLHHSLRDSTDNCKHFCCHWRIGRYIEKGDIQVTKYPEPSVPFVVLGPPGAIEEGGGRCGSVRCFRTGLEWGGGKHRRGGGSCSTRSDGKCESFALQVFSCRVPGLCTHPPLPRYVAFCFSESACRIQPPPLNTEQGQRGAQHVRAACTVLELESDWHVTPVWRWECGGSHPEPCLMRPLEVMHLQLCLLQSVRWALFAPCTRFWV